MCAKWYSMSPSLFSKMIHCTGVLHLICARAYSRTVAAVHLESPGSLKSDHLDTNAELNRIGGLGVSGLEYRYKPSKVSIAKRSQDMFFWADADDPGLYGYTAAALYTVRQSTAVDFAIAKRKIEFPHLYLQTVIYCCNLVVS